MYKKFSHILLISQSLYPFFFPIKVASDGYRRGYVSFAHFLLYFFYFSIGIQGVSVKVSMTSVLGKI